VIASMPYLWVRGILIFPDLTVLVTSRVVMVSKKLQTEHRRQWPVTTGANAKTFEVRSGFSPRDSRLRYKLHPADAQEALAPT
jgi:hypothetical protein